MNNLLLSLSVLCLVTLVLIFLLKKLHQPYLVAYVLAGIVLGPSVSRVFTNAEDISSLGEIGILLSMFFLGMEIEVPDSRSALMKPVSIQFLKVCFCMLFAIIAGKWMGWTSSYIFVLVSVLIFNSTAVVSDYLKRNNELGTPIGRDILNILLIQDVLLAPVLIVFHFLKTGTVNYGSLALPVVGCVLIVLFLRSIRNRSFMQLPVNRIIEQDHDLQVFIGAVICFGFALLTSSLRLSATLGSFLAGIYIGRTNIFHWLESSLRPFKVFFVALFFMSIGLRFDMGYVRNNYDIVLLATCAVFMINCILSSIVFRMFRYPWRNSIYAGALLSQTGEFGLLATALAYQMGIIDDNFYMLIITVVSTSLFFSTTWITFLRKYIYLDNLIFTRNTRYED